MKIELKNKQLLKKLLKIESTSGKEDLVTPLILAELQRLGFRINVDILGNISAIRGTSKHYPLLNAHMDIVDLSSSFYESDDLLLKRESVEGYLLDLIESGHDVSEYVNCKNCCISKYCRNKLTNDVCSSFWLNGDKIEQIYKENLNNTVAVVSPKDDTFIIYEKDNCFYGKGKDRVLGGDDKCGIFIALEIARRTGNLPLKILFTVQEEIGCIGIKHFAENNADWFNDVDFSLTIDRRNGDNLLYKQHEIQSCSFEFASKLAAQGIICGIPVKLENGSTADVIYIRELVKESVNVSAGYYKPHTKDEFVKLDEVEKIIKWLSSFVLKNHKKS